MNLAYLDHITCNKLIFFKEINALILLHFIKENHKIQTHLFIPQEELQSLINKYVTIYG